MDLFEYMSNAKKEKEAPLAARLRPTTLDEVVGQQHIIGKDRLLYRAIKADKLSSIIFYGPPGTGKTTLAKVIAQTTSAEFTQINATVAGKKDMEEVVEKAKELRGMYGRKTILFIDEIHRFNKGQQDYLLPFVEDGTVVLIGATTENPYFEVNGALLSRSVVFELHPLSKEDVTELIHRAVYDKEKGMGAYEAEIDEEAVEFLAEMSGGDARHALNAVELGVMTTNRSEDGKIHITLEVAQECIQKRVLRYDKTGDNHYDTISAFIKSMRGSDPDAAVYYLGRMPYAVCGGECDFYRATDYDLRVGRCGKRRSECVDRSGQCGAGGGARRYAGGAAYFVAGGHLRGLRAQEQRGMRGHLSGDGDGEAAGQSADPAASAGRPLQRIAEAGARHRLQICPRF